MPEKNNPDKILSELEKRRDLKGWISIVATVVAVSAALFHLYTAAGGQLFALSQRAVHLAFIGFLGFLYYPFLPKKSNKVPIYDMFLSLLVVGLGIIVGVVTMTGLGLKLAGYIELYASGVLLYGLILTMVTSLVLGIGLPTTAKYIVLATLVAPALGRLNVSSLIGAHLFILYFATDADITPPVSLTAYATAGLAGSDPLKTSIEAFKLGLSAYLIPFMFIYDPALILIGDPLFIVLSLATAIVGIISLSASIQGFFLDNLNYVERILFALGALSLIYPGLLSDGVGVAILASTLAFHWSKNKKREKTAEASA